ncbi:GNAT family N-acetyltransferase [Nitrosopumilus sp. S4]
MRIKLTLLKNDSDFKNAWKIFNKSFGRKKKFEEFYHRFCHNGNKIFNVINEEKIVGIVMITTRNEIGYFILPEFQRKGFGKKAIKNLMIMEKRKYYWAIVDFDNLKSKQFIQSLGMIPRGLIYSMDSSPE